VNYHQSIVAVGDGEFLAKGFSVTSERLIGTVHGLV